MNSIAGRNTAVHRNTQTENLSKKREKYSKNYIANNANPFQKTSSRPTKNENRTKGKEVIKLPPPEA